MFILFYFILSKQNFVDLMKSQIFVDLIKYHCTTKNGWIKKNQHTNILSTKTHHFFYYSIQRNTTIPTDLL